ncbi:MAG: glutamine amidotransferase, partial [Acidobacteriota bacterium]
MNDNVINLLQLYPRDMNIYGDWGNTLVLKRRLEWHGYQVNLLEYNPGDTFPGDVDLIVGGGGQDSGQTKIGADLLKIGPKLQHLADSGVPMLLICGLYQQFGH